MFKRNQKIEVVPPHEYSDFSDRDPSLSQFATRKDLAIAALAPVAIGAPFIAYKLMNTPETYTAATIPVTTPVIEPINVLAQSPTIIPVSSSEVIQTGYVADASLEMLATVLDPLISIMVAVSFPIASVIMLSGAFFFMLGNSEKALSTIMNAGLGYVIIQMSPLLLDILRSVGEAM